jgi:hypothetical protein
MSTVSIVDFIKGIANRSGIQITEDYQKVLDTDGLNEIPAAWADQMMKNLFGFKTATNNEAIRNAILAKKYGQLQPDIAAALTALGLEYDSLTDGASTFPEAVKMLSNTLPSAIEEKYKDAGGKPDPNREKHADTIRNFQTQVEELTAAIEAEKSTSAAAIARVKEDHAFMGMFGAFTIKDDLMPMRDRLFKGMVDEMRENYIFKNVDNVLTPFLKSNPDIQATGSQNELLSLSDIIKAKMEPLVKKAPKKPDTVVPGNGPTPMPKNEYTFGGAQNRS